MNFIPYAAKAIITHEFDTEHLNIWLTFKYSMNILLKPNNAVWLVDIDGTITAVTTSAWVDEYTMLLVIDEIATQPARVLVEFDGPDGNLETSWHKNWEPWGPILSVSQNVVMIPAGLISLWSGTIATIPAGWVLCNGANGTPDLRNKFIVGANADSGGVAKSTIQDGSALQSGGTKDHRHSFAFTGGIGGNTQATGTTQNVQSGTGAAVPTSGHVHYYSASFGGGGMTDEQRRTSGGSSGEDLVPPFYALAYIMKTDKKKPHSCYRAVFGAIYRVQ